MDVYSLKQDINALWEEKCKRSAKIEDRDTLVVLDNIFKDESIAEIRLVVQSLGEAMNSSCCHKDLMIAGILQGLGSLHRTLQSDLIWALLEALGRHSEARNDGRNESAVAACKDVKKALEDRIFFSRPFKQQYME
jgi:hypothetical protein